MEKSPLRIYDYTVTKDWNIEKAAEYQGNIHKIITHMDKIGKPFTIEYIDENLNVISTLEFKGNEKKFLEYKAAIEKMIKGEQNEQSK